MKKLFAGFSISLLLLAGFLTGCGSSGGGSSDDVTPPPAGSDDLVAPTVLSVFPLDGATDVPMNVKLTASFDMVMKDTSITAESFTVSGPDGVALAGAGTLAPDGLSAVFIPSVSFAANSVYVAKVTTAATRLEGEPLASDYVWSFTTGVLPDLIAPTVLSTVPADGAVAVSLSANITAIFSEVMDPLTVTSSTITLKKGGSSVSGAVTAPLATTVTFNPNANLDPNTTYTATISSLVRDVAGNPMLVDKTWSFKTRVLSALGPAPLDLGTAEMYAILAKAGITNVKTSAVTGNMGISPIAAGAITNFDLVHAGGNPGEPDATSTQVVGKVYAASYGAPSPANLIVSTDSMEAAYTDAAGRTIDAILDFNGGELGGQTLVPGLYKWTTAVAINNGNLTLAGSDNDVWIFQIGGTLTMASGKSVLLSGSSLAKNIFWQVPDYVEIGTDAHIEGIVLSATSITLLTGSSIKGRLYAQTNVALQKATVTQPAP